MTHLELDGRRLEYRWIGPGPDDAPTLVLLHEGLGCVSLWKDFPDRLAEATGCGVLIYSRWGHGRSDAAELPRPVGFMHAEATGVLPRVLDATGVRAAVLFGHSDGASIALIYAGAAADARVRALVLEAPHVFVEPLTLESIAAMAEAWRTTDLPARLARHHGANAEGAFWGWNRVWLDPQFRGWNIEPYLPRVTAPVLLVQGRGDQYGTERQLEAVRAQAGGSVDTLLLDRCGHAPHRDRPELVLAATAAFVREVLSER